MNAADRLLCAIVGVDPDAPDAREHALYHYRRTGYALGQIGDTCTLATGPGGINHSKICRFHDDSNWTGA